MNKSIIYVTSFLICIFSSTSFATIFDSILEDVPVDIEIQKWHLSIEENTDVFKKNFENVFFNGAETTEHPTAIIVAGQPGSGKSRLIDTLDTKPYAAGKFTILDIDDFRPLHPHIAQIRQEHCLIYGLCTHHDATVWFNRLEDEGLSRKFNFLFNWTLKNQYVVMDGFKKLKENNYRIILKIMAVRPEFSEQSIVERYEQAKIENGDPRMVPRSFHKECFHNLPESIGLIEQQHLADVITLQRRDGSIIYENEWIDGAWARPAGARQALLDERLRPMNVEEKAEQCARVTRIVKLMVASGSAKDEARFSKMVELKRNVCPPSPVPTLFLNPFRRPIPAWQGAHPFPGNGATTFGHSIL